MTFYEFCKNMSIMLDCISIDGIISKEKIKYLDEKFNAMNNNCNSYVSTAMDCIILSIGIDKENDVGIFIPFSNKVINADLKKIIWHDFDNDTWISIINLKRSEVLDDSIKVDELSFNIIYRGTFELQTYDTFIRKMDNKDEFIESFKIMINLAETYSRGFKCTNLET